MRIAQVIVTGQNQVELQQVELDERLAPGEFLVQTEYTFISAGTELANYTGKEPQVFQKGSWCAYPWASGYGNVGTVTAVGPGVTRTKVGERVYTFCAHASTVKSHQDNLVLAVPAGLDPALAVASRMAGVATTSTFLAERAPDAWVLVFGLGMVGNLAAQGFAILGHRVIGVDPVASRRELALRCGITHAVGGTPDEVKAAILALTGGTLPEIVVEATGLSPVGVQALGLTASHGQLILLGSPRAPMEGNITAVLSEIHLRNIVVRGALEWCIPVYPAGGNWGASVAPQFTLTSKQRLLFDWALRGKLHLAPLISHRLPPTKIKDAYEGLLRQPETYTGVVLDWR